MELPLYRSTVVEVEGREAEAVEEGRVEGAEEGRAEEEGRVEVAGKAGGSGSLVSRLVTTVSGSLVSLPHTDNLGRQMDTRRTSCYMLYIHVLLRDEKEEASKV